MGIVALVAVIAATDLIAVLIVKGSHSWPGDCFLWGLVLSQNGLVWIWAGLGQTRLVFRLTASMLALLGVVKMLAWGERGPHDADADVLLLFLAMAVATLMVTIPLRIFGVLLKTKEAPPPQGMRLQFSLWNVMEATTAVAVLLGLSKLVVPSVSFDGLDHPLLLVFLTMGFPFAALIGLMTWVLLRPRFAAPLLLILGVGIWVASLVASLILHEPDDGQSFEVAAAVAAITFGILIVCRLCGYRVGKWPAIDIVRGAPTETVQRTDS